METEEQRKERALAVIGEKVEAAQALLLEAKQLAEAAGVSYAFVAEGYDGASGDLNPQWDESEEWESSSVNC